MHAPRGRPAKERHACASQREVQPMSWWMKWAGWSALIFFPVGVGLIAVANEPPVDQTLEEVGSSFAAVGVVCGLIFLRSLWSWERWKFRAAAWRAGRKSRPRLSGRHSHRSRDEYADAGRWFKWRDGQATFAQRKYRGQTLTAVAKSSPDYLQWMLRLDLPVDTRRMVAYALNAESPGRKS